MPALVLWWDGRCTAARAEGSVWALEGDWEAPIEMVPGESRYVELPEVGWYAIGVFTFDEEGEQIGNLWQRDRLYVDGELSLGAVCDV